MTTTVSERPVSTDAPTATTPPPHRWIPWAVAAIALSAGAFYAYSAATPALHGYYTPAVVSMSESLRNFVFGAYDSAGLSGIDKIPGSLWPQALSVAVFGTSAWSIVLPGLLATVATIAVLYLTATLWRGRVAGLAAAAVYATMPLAAALSKSNVPEVWFALALCIVAYLTMRAVRSGRLVWLLAAGLAVAAAFQVKMLEAWMVYPALALAYLVAAPRPRWTRVWHTLVAGLVSIAASLWWIVLVTVTPAAERPWVGGTADNSAWSMVFGYNGFGRVTGAQGTFIANFAGDAGLSRLVGSQVGADVAWFLPLAVVAGVLGLVLAVRSRDRVRLGGSVFATVWLVPVALTMAYSAGIHTFYVAAFAPAIALLVGGLVPDARELSRSAAGRLGVAALLAGQAAWTCWLVLRLGDHPWLVGVVAAATCLGLALFLGGRRVGLALAALALLAAPLTWTLGTTGSLNATNPSAGTSSAPGGPGVGGPPSGPTGRGPGSGGRGGGGGSASFDNAAATELRTWLESHSAGSTYLVAADSSVAGDLVLAGAHGVVALGGGFHGSDPTPTADQLAEWVESGQLRYVVVSGGRGPGGGPRTAWLQATCTVVSDAPSSLGTVYDCAP
ncbi:MAG: glycosyltransferase family 39 protein [Candidatus Nanopelagicales bacterium]|jgi:4-amino-4-deoxy-L-arabinose transferase-like glycosyltransferase